VVPVTVTVTLEPVAVSEPPVINRPPLIVELAATDSDPPVIESGSSLVTEWTDCVPVEILTVAPTLSIVTSSPEPGT
jgi:hypothetical protein